jgi:hypothetical protein
MRTVMPIEIEPIPGVTDDPVIQLILSGRAQTFEEAEELYLKESLPAIVELIGSPLSNEELEKHPLMRLLRSHGMRGREDSLL